MCSGSLSHFKNTRPAGKTALSWRDTKAAVLVFNRNVNFTEVLSTITAVVPKHPHCKREVARPGETTFRYVFGHPPLTPAEVEAIARRVQVGDRLEPEEVERLEQHSPVIHGEVLITTHKGHVNVKRYGGLDLAEL